MTDVELADLLKEHYDTEQYGLRYAKSCTFTVRLGLALFLYYSVVTIRRLRKKWGILSTRQQKHTPESIYDKVYEIRRRFPMRGIEGIRLSLRMEHGIRASR